jgi:hypothetical protein
MGEVVFDISMSLDGFITGPNDASSIRSARTMDGSPRPQRPPNEER